MRNSNQQRDPQHHNTQVLACPNCFGTQLYAGCYSQKQEVNNSAKAFIQKFVEKYL